MAYLTIKKVKGRYYGYLQESYREGGRVHTRTVEYLGAVEPAVAQQVQTTRAQLGQVDQAALIQSVRAATSHVVASTSPPQQPAAAPTDESALATSKPHPTQVSRGQPTSDHQNHPAAHPTTTDSPTPQVPSAELPKPVITTAPAAKSAPPPTTAKVAIPADLDHYRVSRTALERTGTRFARRLQAMGVDPSAMPEVTIRYGHPDRLEPRPDGSYVVYASRRTQNQRHQLNKTKLWSHYRQALAGAYLNALATDQPEVHHQLRVQLDASHQATTRWLLQSLAVAQTPVQRLGLSLQLRLWHRLPQQLTKKQSAEMFGQASFSTVNDWRREAAFVLAEAHRPGGWQGFADRQQAATRRLKSAITRRRNQLDRMGWGQRFAARLSGKRRRLLREIMAHEARLRVVEQLDRRLTVLRHHFPL